MGGLKLAESILKAAAAVIAAAMSIVRLIGSIGIMNEKRRSIAYLAA